MTTLLGGSPILILTDPYKSIDEHGNNVRNEQVIFFIIKSTKPSLMLGFFVCDIF